MGLNDSITMSFLLVGHTKFTPDACFGLFKKKFHVTHTQTLQDIVDVVNNSAECNVAQVVGWENGEVLVSTYDWSTHLIEKMKKNSRHKAVSPFYIQEQHTRISYL